MQTNNTPPIQQLCCTDIAHYFTSKAWLLTHPLHRQQTLIRQSNWLYTKTGDKLKLKPVTVNTSDGKSATHCSTDPEYRAANLHHFKAHITKWC